MVNHTGKLSRKEYTVQLKQFLHFPICQSRRFKRQAENHGYGKLWSVTATNHRKRVIKILAITKIRHDQLVHLCHVHVQCSLVRKKISNTYLQ